MELHFIWLTFIPLFVAVDAFGTLPILVGLMEHVDTVHRRRVIIQSVLTAATVAGVFVLGGRPLLRLLGVTASDFMIAGGENSLRLSWSREEVDGRLQTIMTNIHANARAAAPGRIKVVAVGTFRQALAALGAKPAENS